MTRRLEMDHYFMRMAFDLASQSSCSNRKVGAVLVTADGKNVVTAVNNPYPNRMQCAEEGCLRALRKISSGNSIEVCRCIHCEASLISQCAKAGIATINATVYTTLFPCSICAKILANAGIKRLVYSNNYSDNLSVELFRRMQIQVERYQRY